MSHFGSEKKEFFNEAYEFRERIHMSENIQYFIRGSPVLNTTPIYYFHCFPTIVGRLGLLSSNILNVACHFLESNLDI